MPEKTVYLGLGSNLGDRRANLESSLAALEREEIRVRARSSIYETEPQEMPNQPWFLNLVAVCETRLFPIQLLTVLQRIERELGRTRTAATHKGPRIVDIDILLFGNLAMRTRKLTIPHPGMVQRRFVLEPLLEVAPDLRMPPGSEPLLRTLAKLKGQVVRKI